MKWWSVFPVVGGILFAVSCGKKKETPPVVQELYERLKSEVDEDALGESIKKLEEFKRMYSSYKVSDEAGAELKRLRAKVKGRFLEARELARVGRV